ncbi:hypothetical protein GH714_018242 [Hevea brasiliensis]|uniref:Disease resistance N-terminal domain-containing protein n=1 Tax=Hevea brasiliensis TaxID=3981 RepID=A0A6A6N2T0_HEVBR|nr:hypothetical protein GH714_018242 [Hevea brasiliensis]
MTFTTAVSFIAESALSSFIQALFERIECPEFLKFARERQVSAEINEWEKRLRTIQAMLEDAEEKQMSNQSVKMWLDELKDLAYDVEDILDEFQTESLQRQLKGETEAGSSKLRKLFILCQLPSIQGSHVQFNDVVQDEGDHYQISADRRPAKRLGFDKEKCWWDVL